MPEMTRDEMRRAAVELVADWPEFDETTKADLRVLLHPEGPAPAPIRTETYVANLLATAPEPTDEQIVTLQGIFADALGSAPPPVSPPVAPPRRMAPLPPPPVRMKLYRAYDAADVPLYIGITGDPERRDHRHEMWSTWKDFAVRETEEWFDDRPSAIEAEKAAILAERPLFNRQYNNTPEARQRLVAYLVEHNRLDLLAPAVSRG